MKLEAILVGCYFWVAFGVFAGLNPKRLSTYTRALLWPITLGYGISFLVRKCDDEEVTRGSFRL